MTNTTQRITDKRSSTSLASAKTWSVDVSNSRIRFSDTIYYEEKIMETEVEQILSFSHMWKSWLKSKVCD